MEKILIYGRAIEIERRYFAVKNDKILRLKSIFALLRALESAASTVPPRNWEYHEDGDVGTVNYADLSLKRINYSL